MKYWLWKIEAKMRTSVIKNLKYIPVAIMGISITLVLVGCAETNTANPPATAIVTPTNITPGVISNLTNQDICNLLSESEVKAILNSPLVKIESTSNATNACTFSSSQTNKPLFFIVAQELDVNTKEAFSRYRLLSHATDIKGISEEAFEDESSTNTTSVIFFITNRTFCVSVLGDSLATKSERLDVGIKVAQLIQNRV